jgi:hypothetical protein
LLIGCFFNGAGEFGSQDGLSCCEIHRAPMKGFAKSAKTGVNALMCSTHPTSVAIAAWPPVSGLYFQATIVGLQPSQNRAGDLALVVLAL